MACSSASSGTGQSPFVIRESHIRFINQTRSTFDNPDTVAKDLGFKNPSFPYYAPSDGCSGGISERGMRRFRWACLQHDYCYRVGAQGRAECDEIFLDLMRKKCSDLNIAVRPICYAEAQSMFAAVRVWSNEVFAKRQRNQKRYENVLTEALEFTTNNADN